ncbi:hypothetical protein BGZ70_010191 [Mortierella alpina]|uniref:Uncharacterized protein n=1 Tax=Mortierella alpina TaxID=64518 RepID=A0A9P6IZS4_MORAP|nr:hypothetical protein BGZ70_010191 [Mortierella alpina]
MEPKLALSKGRRALVGYRWGLVVLAVVMLALDFATIGLFNSLMNPRFRGFHGLIMFNGDYAILVVPDVLAIVFFALLAFRPQGFAPLKNLSSRVLTGCRVFFSLGLTALVLYGPAMELDVIMGLAKDQEADLDEHEIYQYFLLCARGDGPDFDPMSRKNDQYCQVARARWFLGFFLALLMFGELTWSYFAKDFKVQQESERRLHPETGEYKTMLDSQGVA